MIKQMIKNHSFRRRGVALFVIVLSTALIVSVLGLAAIKLVRIRRVRVQRTVDLVVAQMNARSAIEYAMLVISEDSNWRTTHLNGVETGEISLGPDHGTVSWVLEDSDGSLTDSDTVLRVDGVGRFGVATQVMSVEISGTPELLDTLQCSVYAVGDMTQSSNTTTTSGPFASAGIFSVGGTVYGDVEGDPVVNAGVVTGTTTSPGPDRTMPSASVWDTYVAIATPIPYTSFISYGSYRAMERGLLGATVNPFGPTNSEGVYLIQIPDGKTLSLWQVRIHGTLLIELGVNSTFEVTSACLWEPSNGLNYPALIAKGGGIANLAMSGSNSRLKEASPPPQRNFNPIGEPYDGITDTDQSDQYDSLIRGLFHVIGSDVTSSLSSNLNINGVFITEGPATLSSNLEVTVDPSLYSNPPMGYSADSGDMSVVGGSWLKTAAPPAP